MKHNDIPPTQKHQNHPFTLIIKMKQAILSLSFKQLAIFLSYFKCHSFKLPLINFNFSPNNMKRLLLFFNKIFLRRKSNTSTCKGVGPNYLRIRNKFNYLLNSNMKRCTYLVSNPFKYNRMQYRNLKTGIFEQPFVNNFHDNLIFLSFRWSKTMEREKERECKNIMWVWEIKLSKSF